MTITANRLMTGVFVHAIHKSATMFLYRFFRDISNRKGFEYYSANNDPPNDVNFSGQSHSNYCVCPIRSFDQVGLTQPENECHKRIIHIRDPRDILVSEYFSFGWTHSQSDGKLTDARKTEIQNMTIDEYVLNQPEFSSWHLGQKLEPLMEAPPSDSTTVVRYETMVTQFPRWVSQVIKPFKFRIPTIAASRLSRKYRNEFRPSDTELSHKRNVTPGDHVDKLKPGTIAILNDRFQDFLIRFDYLR